MKKSGKGGKYIFADTRVKMVPTTANNLTQLLTGLRMEREER